MTEYKHQIGDVLEARNSGKHYVIETEGYQYKGQNYYSVTGWKNGKRFGPARRMSETAFNTFRIETAQDDENGQFGGRCINSR